MRQAPAELSFTGAGRPDNINEMLSEKHLSDAVVFDPAALYRLVEALS